MVSINPQNADAIYSRAIVKAELLDPEGAMNNYDRALKIAPDFWGALTNRGCLKDETGDPESAINDQTLIIEGARKGCENYILAYANGGNSKLHLGDIQGACADWKNAQALGADSVSERIKKHCQECE